MDEITTYKENTEYNFKVLQEEFEIEGYKGIYYKIMIPEWPNYDWKHFQMKIVFVYDNRILLYWLDNQNIPEVSNKGIIKKMMNAISSEFKKNIISSTNDGVEIIKDEGRIPDVTKYWNKWVKENENVTYDKNDDRFIYGYMD